MDGLFSSDRLVALVLVTLVNMNLLLCDPSCSHVSIGEPTPYFGDYQEVSYNASCGQLCTLPVSQDPLQVTQLRVFFPPNRTQASCTWIIPGFQNDRLSTVMYFEQSQLRSLAHYVVCGEAAPTLSLWDEYSAGSEVRTTYTICRDKDEDSPEAYSRRSSRLGNFNTLITLTDYDVGSRANPTLLKYITVDWSQDCFKDYREIMVGPLENKTTLGSQWFTSNLRFPNGMHCRWKFSALDSTGVMRVRVAVLGRTSIPGTCARDDTVRLEDSAGSETFTLCDDSPPFFYSSLSGSVNVDFNSGPTSGAPEFEFSYSTLDPCPRDRLYVESDLVENVVYGLSDPALSYSTCNWNLYTNWTNNVIMLTRLDHQPFQQDCTDEDYLDVDLGMITHRISLCEAAPFPLWSDGLSANINLNHNRRPSSRKVSIFYKSVPKVPNCQGIPGQLEAVLNKQTSILVDLALHTRHPDVSAPDCRWLVHPSSQLTEAESYAAEVTVSDSGSWPDMALYQPNSTTANWLISGFRAYPGSAVNASSTLSKNCYFTNRAVECQFLSSGHTLLLVYDPSLSTSPVPLDRVSLSFREVKKVSSGQAGGLVRAWHAQWLSLCVAVVLGLVSC